VSRPRAHDYAGAAASRRVATLQDALSLGSQWAVQPKLDGWHAVVRTDRTGRVRHVQSRNGQPVPLAMSGHLFGAWIGWPESVLHGELVGELVHLFDVSQADGVRVAERPYGERRDLLWRMQSEVVGQMPQLSWSPIEGLRARDRASGQYTRAAPEDWRLCPVVEQHALSAAARLWDAARAGQLEGLVLVNLRAKLGARGSKLKLKPVQTIDATVIRVDRGGCIAYLAGEGRVVALGRQRGVDVQVGDVVEIAHEGRYGSGELRFARLDRVRPDLAPVVPLRRVT